MPTGVYTRTEKHRQNLSLALKGHTSPRKGCHLSEETKRKLSISMQGRTASLETRIKMSTAHTDKQHTKETKAKLRQIRLDNPTFTSELRIKTKHILTGKHLTQEHIEKIRLASTGKEQTPISRRRKATAMRKLWANPNYRDRVVKAVISASHKRPTQPEETLGEILQLLFPNQYKYTGDGTMIIGGLCPDFTNVNGQKKVIEMFGDYWHEGQDPQVKINRYRDFGFNCLVIWESELNNHSHVTKRIVQFCGGYNQDRYKD